jgi:hypothetical protein
VSSFGTTDTHIGGRGAQVLAHLQGARKKPHGLTIDWDTVEAVAGQNEIVTLAVTAETGNITFVFGGQTATVAYDASAETLETAIEALSTVGNGNVKVTKASSVFTVEFINDLAKTNVGTVTSSGTTVAVVQEGAADADLTLGDGTVVKAGKKYIPAGTILSQITASGKYGPADTSASDGRQTVDATQRGKSWILNEDIFEDDLGSDHNADAFDAGTVYEARLKVGGTNQPTRTNFVAMFPQVRFAS